MFAFSAAVYDGMRVIFLHETKIDKIFRTLFFRNQILLI